MVRDGMLFASDPISAEGFVANIADFFVNSTVGYLGGLVAGDLLFAATGNPMAALTGAEVTNQAVKSIGILDQQVFLGADGRQYMQTDSAFGEPTFVAIEDAAARSAAIQQQASESISSGTFDGSGSLAAGIGSATTDTAVTSTKSEPSWKDYYSFSLDPGDAIKEVLTGVNVNPEIYKAAQLALRIDAGEDLSTAALGVYGGDLVNFLPEDFKNPTEAAIRIAAGEDRVGVLGDIYGADLGLDNPLGLAGIDAASVYDQTGDGDEALKSGLITYFKEGGTLPEFDAPDFLDGVAADVDFNFDFLSDINMDLGLSLPEWVSNIEIPTGIFDGVNFGDIKAQFGSVDLPSLPDLGIELGSIDFSGLSFPEISSDLSMGLPELAEFDVDFSGVDFEGVDFMDLGVGVGELADLGIDWQELNFGDIPLPELVLIAADKAEEEQTEEEKLALEIAMPDIVDPKGVDIAKKPAIARPFSNPLLG